MGAPIRYYTYDIGRTQLAFQKKFLEGQLKHVATRQGLEEDYKARLEHGLLGSIGGLETAITEWEKQDVFAQTWWDRWVFWLYNWAVKDRFEESVEEPAT